MFYHFKSGYRLPHDETMSNNKKYRLFGLLFSFLFLHFFQDDRNIISNQYQSLMPLLRTTPIQALADLENIANTAGKKLTEKDTLLANIRFSLAKIYCDNNINLNTGIDYYRSALNIRLAHSPENTLKIGQTAHNLAVVFRQKGFYEDAKKYAEIAVNNKLKATSVDTPSLMRSYTELAAAYRYLGDNENSIAISEKRLQLANSLNDRQAVAACHIDIGGSYFDKKTYDKAAVEFQVALSIFDAILNAKPSGSLTATPSVSIVQKDKAACLNNLGVTNRLLNRKAASLSYMNQAYTAYGKVLETTKDSSIVVYMGNVLMEKASTESLADGTASSGSLANALKGYEEALKVFGNLRHPFVVECHTAKGNTLVQLNRTNEALNSFQNAVNVRTLGASEPDVLKNPLLPDNIYPELFAAYSAKAQVLSTNNETTAAFDAYKKCDTIITRLYQLYQEDKSKYILAEKVLPIYEKAISTAHNLFEKTSDAQYSNAALALSGRNKAIALLEGLKDNKAKNFAGVPDSMRQAERNLKTDIAFFEKKLYEAPDSLKTQVKDEVFMAKQALMMFNKDLEAKYPKYFNFKSQMISPLSATAEQNRIKDIQSSIDDKTVVVEYFLGDSALYIFGFNNKDFYFNREKLPANNAFLTQFKNLRKSLSDDKMIADSNQLAEQTFLLTSHDFYRLLLQKPLASLNKSNNINRLRLIPDGVLGYLPFELLLTETATTWKGNATPYLLRKYAVSYAYSNQLLGKNGGNIDGGEFGGFGIEYSEKAIETIKTDVKPDSTPSTRGGKLSRLAFADDEVKNIRTLLGSGTIFLNDDATKFAFMQNAGNHGILHLAMHGAIDDKNPLNSSLIFAKKDSADNNLLNGYDIYNMQLKTGLAVLSACNTGVGELQRGEGVMSLARAFAFAGCPSTVMSLWSIPDESTSKVMMAFYKNLKNGDTKDVALQKAKLEYLDNCPPQYSIPNYWGASVVIGNVEAMSFRAWYQHPAVIGLGVVLLLLLLVYFLRRKP